MSKPGRNDPCPCGSGKKYKHCCLLNPKPHVVEPVTVLTNPVNPGWTANPWTPNDLPPDDDSWEPYDFDDEEEVTPSTPLEAAYFLSQDGWLADESEHISIAKEALALSPDCIEAYLLWASAVNDPEERLALCDKALAAADRDLGVDWLERHPVRVWSDSLAVSAAHDARRDRGQALLSLGRNDEALALLHEVVRADPEDPDGTRDQILSELLDLGREGEAVDLLNEFPNEFGAIGLYVRALLKYRAHGDTFWPRRAAISAISYDPELAGLLTSSEAEKRELLESEALLAFGIDIIYASEILTPIWEKTPGALAWLGAIFDAGPDANLDELPRGDGPVLSLTPSQSEGYTKCPRCHRKTKQQRREIVLMLEPDDAELVEITCRTCDNSGCNILCLLARDVNKAAEHLAKEAGRSPFARDFITIGVIDPTYHHHPFESPEQKAAAIGDYIRGWSDEIRLPSEFDSPLPETFAELDQLLATASAAGLFDPLSNPQPATRKPVKKKKRR